MKNDLQTLRLFSPLFPHIYRRNEWGDYENEPEDLTASEILEFEDIILDRIKKEKLPSEGERGLAVYLHDDALSEKVHSKGIMLLWQPKPDKHPPAKPLGERTMT